MERNEESDQRQGGGRRDRKKGMKRTWVSENVCALHGLPRSGSLSDRFTAQGDPSLTNYPHRLEGEEKEQVSVERQQF